MLNFVSLAPLPRTSHRDTLTCTLRNHETNQTRRAFLAGVLRLSGAATLMSANTLRASAAPDPSATTAGSTTVPTKPRKLSWGYVDDIGPESWGRMSEEWAICDTGKRQSPIELSYKSSRLAGMSEARPELSVLSKRFTLRHKEAMPAAKNKWLLIEPYVPPPPAVIGDAPPVDTVKPPTVAVLTLPGVGKYRLKGAHFHTNGSEHVLNGKQGLMEVHFVFAFDKALDPTSVQDTPRGAGSSHCVVGVLINEGENTTPWIGDVLSPLRSSASDELDSSNGKYIELDLEQILPNFNNSNLYTYDGSLTTPPGSEGIHWMVMNQRASVTREDCELLQNYQGGPNTRPLQDPNGREVVQFPAVLAEKTAPTN